MAKSLPEDPVAKKFRERKKKIWLYHSIPKKNIINVRNKGLDIKYHGITHGSPIEHPTGKPAFSYSTNKSYSVIWGSKEGVVLVHAPTKDLFFAIRNTRYAR